MSNNRIDISKNDVFDYEAKLIYITYSKFENDWTSLMHFHPFSEIFYVVGNLLLKMIHLMSNKMI